MKKDFIILDSDENALFDAMSEKFTAKVTPICGNQFFKVEVETGEGETSDFFNAAIYDDKHTAQREVKRLYRTLKKFRQGKCGEVNAFAFKPSDVTALEILTSFEIHSELDRAKKLRNARMSAVEDCICKVENFLDKLHITNLQKGGV